MSSFLGHTLAAFTISKADLSRRWNILWFLWLTVLASAPDIDYVLPVLHLGLMRARITHSLVGALVLPVFTIAILCFIAKDIFALRRLALQALLAGLSHPVLDLLVGVTPLPLFWPFSLERFHLPAGVLPSAGRISLGNPYLYRNTFIELAVLMPLSALVVFRQRLRPGHRLLLAAISLGFMGWAFSLSRQTAA